MSTEAQPATQTGENDQKGLSGLISKHGDSSTVAALLYGENHKYRSRLRSQKSQIEALTAELAAVKAAAPAEGSLLFSGEDAAVLQTLGLTPAQIKEQLDRLAILDNQVVEQTRKALIENAAKAASFKVDVLSELVQAKGLTLEVVEEGEGEAKTQKYLVKTGADAEGIELTTYATENLKPFLPALQETSSQGEGTGIGERWTEQRPADKAPQTRQTAEQLTSELRSTGIYDF